MKAFHRLAENIKKNYPHLPICILGDSLYATETLFGTCEKNHWDYIIRLKDGAMPTVAEEFHRLKDKDPENACQSEKGRKRHGMEGKRENLPVGDKQANLKGKYSEAVKSRQEEMENRERRLQQSEKPSFSGGACLLP